MVEHNIKNGDILSITIETLTFGGEGLGRYGNIVVFVPMSVPGDKLEIEIISTKKRYVRGLIKNIIEPSDDRVGYLSKENGEKNRSKITFEDFQGCNFGMLTYPAQLKYKQEMVIDVLSKIAGETKTEDYILHEILSSPEEINYRNKVIQPIGFSKETKKIITGFYKQKSHDIFEVKNNILQSNIANVLIKRLIELLNESKLKVYNHKKGLLRNIMVKNNSKGEAMLVLIVNKFRNKFEEERVENVLLQINREFIELKSVYVSINDKDTNFVLGKKNILIAGTKTIKENLNGIKYNISPNSFFQINYKQTKNLYDKAISFFDDIENKTIIDAYSGTGTIGMLLSNSAKKIYAIESVVAAVEDAKQTARENEIKNIDFICGKVEDKIKNLMLNSVNRSEKIDSIIFDPPRKGLDFKVLEALNVSNIDEIVYISCNPSTFARDTKILLEMGYKLKEVQPVDMFPQTSHIEIIGKFKK